MKKLLKLVKIWLNLAEKYAQMQLINRKTGLLFLLGKLVRFIVYFIFIYSVAFSSKEISGYSSNQIVLFFLVFNIVDITTQFLYRGVYVFRPLVSSGNFDLDLLKPYPASFRPVFGYADILDLITLFPLCIFFIYFMSKNGFLSPGNLLIFFLFLIISMILAYAIHLFVCSVCILTMEIDHLIMVYRDLSNMARFPTEIYPKGVRNFLTFIVPIVVLVTVPANALLGLLTWKMAIISIMICGFFVFLSVRFWRYAVSQYTSASS